MAVYRVEVTKENVASFEDRIVQKKDGSEMRICTQDCYVVNFNVGDKYPTLIKCDIDLSNPIPYPEGNYTLDIKNQVSQYGKPEMLRFQPFYLVPFVK